MAVPDGAAREAADLGRQPASTPRLLTCQAETAHCLEALPGMKTFLVLLFPTKGYKRKPSWKHVKVMSRALIRQRSEGISLNKSMCGHFSHTKQFLAAISACSRRYLSRALHIFILNCLFRGARFTNSKYNTNPYSQSLLPWNTIIRVIGLDSIYLQISHRFGIYYRSVNLPVCVV